MKPCLTIIVDDDPISMAHLGQHLQAIEYVEVLETFHDPTLALDYLLARDVQLVILNVDLSSMDPLAFLSAMPESGAQVLCYSDHAHFEYPAYARQLTGFLQKPLSSMHLRQSMQRVLERFSYGRYGAEWGWMGDGNAFFQVKGERKFMRTRVLFREITHIVKSGKHLLIYRSGGLEPLISRESFQYVQSLLPPRIFIRCANGTLFNSAYFISYEDQRIRLHQVEESILTGKLAIYRDLRRFLEQNKI